MDSPDTPSGPSPKPLRVRKASHKIRKPPVAPPPPAGEAQPQHHHPPPPPPPVIIYTEDPQIIHVDPNEFKTVVQQLTGQNTSPPSAAFQENDGGISPAAATSSEPVLNSNFNENSLIRTNYLITPSVNMMNTPAPKDKDIFSTLFDL